MNGSGSPGDSVEGGRGGVRRMLLWLVVLGILATAAELVLLEHTEETAQWVPIVLLAAGLPVTLGAALRPGPATLAAFRLVMLAFVVAGIVGLWLHFRGNVEFELEMYPGLEGLALARKALSGATPALAPGMMSHLGLIGLASAWRHPAGRRPAGAPAHPDNERSPS